MKIKTLVLLLLLLTACDETNTVLKSFPLPVDVTTLDNGVAEKVLYYISYSTNSKIEDTVEMYNVYLADNQWVDMGEEKDGDDTVLSFYKEELNHTEVVTIRIAPEDDEYIVVVMYNSEGVKHTPSY